MQLSGIPDCLKIVEVPLSELREDTSNAREHGKKNMLAIEQSLRKWGQREPLLVRKETMTVIGGNGRLNAMHVLGWQTAYVTLHDLDSAQAKEFAILLNKSGELSSWNWGALAQNLAEIKLANRGLENAVTGFNIKEMDKICASYSMPEDFPGTTGGVPDDFGIDANSTTEPAQPEPDTNEKTFRVVVDCDSESSAREVLDIMQGQGYRCQAMFK